MRHFPCAASPVHAPALSGSASAIPTWSAPGNRVKSPYRQASRQAKSESAPISA
jgi:hypothetical protein